MKKTWIIILIAVLIIAVIIGVTTCGKNKPAEEPTKEVAATEAPAKPAPTPTEAPVKAEEPAPAPAYTDALEEIRSLIAEGKYYEAAQAVVACRETYPEAAEECDALWEQIKQDLADRRPETGVMERTFRYQGGNRIEISSEAKDVELTVTSLEGHGYARYYIREGESVTFYLPCYRFSATYNVGEIWFDDEIGFGEFCENRTLDGGLRFKYSDVPGWVVFHFIQGNPDVQVRGENIVPGN